MSVLAIFSIRRIVQDDRFFFKIKPGLWALNSHKEEVLKKFSLDEKSPVKKKEEFSHTYYQGLLIEIGNVNYTCLKACAF